MLASQQSELNRFLSVLTNISIIGNYGMDDGWAVDGNICHRPGQDIVVPQYLGQSAINAFHDFIDKKQLGIEHRIYDSIFSGVVWFNRMPLEVMAKADAFNYINNHTERYLFTSHEPFNALLYNPYTYFMYSPCGNACWSARMYDGMAYFLIPIVINTGAIQAFERYFDWTQFTVKMNISTFENPDLFIKYRQKLRIEVDLVRSILEEHRHELAVEYAYSSKNYSQHSPHRTKNNFKLELYKPSSISMKKLLETTIYKKLIAIRKVFRWFIYHETGEIGRPNAYRLLTLEMWCRVAPLASKPSVCSRPVNALSALEYV